MAEKLKIVKLWKRNFIEDLGDSGNFFKITPIFRDVKDETEAGLNIRIDRANRILQGPRKSISPNYFCTLMLTPGQLDGISDDWKSKWAGKTILMVHDYNKKIEETAQMDVKYWHGEGTDLFLWSNPDNVYTRADGDKLNFRYPVVSKAVVDKFKDDETAPTPTPTPIPPPPPAPPPNPMPILVAGNRYVLKGTAGNFGTFDLTLEVSKI